MMITTDEKILRNPCEDVGEDEVASLISKLESSLENYNKNSDNGIGLAAPQIGISKKIAIIRMGDTNLNLVNAKIANQYDPIIFKGEGCLSFPNKFEDTVRYSEVHVVDNLVHPHSFVATGFLAIAIQHELDHYNSILITDRKANKVMRKARPNDPCTCGSGKKFKKCCGT